MPEYVFCLAGSPNMAMVVTLGQEIETGNKPKADQDVDIALHTLVFSSEINS